MLRAHTVDSEQLCIHSSYIMAVRSSLRVTGSSSSYPFSPRKETAATVAFCSNELQIEPRLQLNGSGERKEERWEKSFFTVSICEVHGYVFFFFVLYFFFFCKTKTPLCQSRQWLIVSLWWGALYRTLIFRQYGCRWCGCHDSAEPIHNTGCQMEADLWQDLCISTGYINVKGWGCCFTLK